MGKSRLIGGLALDDIDVSKWGTARILTTMFSALQAISRFRRS
jgi:hypothetical protein